MTGVHGQCSSTDVGMEPTRRTAGPGTRTARRSSTQPRHLARVQPRCVPRREYLPARPTKRSLTAEVRRSLASHPRAASPRPPEFLRALNRTKPPGVPSEPTRVSPEPTGRDEADRMASYPASPPVGRAPAGANGFKPLVACGSRAAVEVERRW